MTAKDWVSTFGVDRQYVVDTGTYVKILSCHLSGAAKDNLSILRNLEDATYIQESGGVTVLRRN
jgi:hypothetical protein